MPDNKEAQSVRKPEVEPVSEQVTEEKEESKGEMGFLDHLEELRTTIIRSFVALIIGCALVMTGIKYFADMLNWPLNFALGDDAHRGLVTTSPMAVFAVILQVSFMGGFAMALPFILYFVSSFISPGLTSKELKMLKPGCFLALLMFLTGASFAYFALVPASLKASIFFNDMFGYQLFWSADRYYGLLMRMTIGIGLSFEFPLLIVLLVYIGILDTDKLIAFRPYSIIVFLGLAAVITPTTDPFTFLLLAVPMSILYEGSVYASRRISRRRAEQTPDEEEGEDEDNYEDEDD